MTHKVSQDKLYTNRLKVTQNYYKYYCAILGHSRNIQHKNLKTREPPYSWKKKCKKNDATVTIFLLTKKKGLLHSKLIKDMSLVHGVNSVNAIYHVMNYHYTPLLKAFGSELEAVVSLTRPIAMAKWKIPRSVKNLVVRHPLSKYLPRS